MCASPEWKLSRVRFYEELREQTNYWDVCEKEQDNKRLGRASALWSSDPAEAVHEARAMAEGGSVWALGVLGWAYETGTGTTRDLATAIDWYHRSLAAGSEIAVFDLGRAYLAAGEFEEAERVYAIGVARDWPQAMYCMAKVCMKRGAPTDHGKARTLLERAVSQGSLHAKIYLSRLLIRGRFGWRAVPSGLRLAWNTMDSLEALLDDSGSRVREDMEQRQRPQRSFFSRPRLATS